MSEEQDFEAHAAFLRTRFKERLAQDRERLLSSLAALDTRRPEALATMREIAHRLAGSAAVFGFTAVGGAAADLDEALQANFEEGLGEVPALARGLLAELDCSLKRA